MSSWGVLRDVDLQNRVADLERQLDAERSRSHRIRREQDTLVTVHDRLKRKTGLLLDLVAKLALGGNDCAADSMNTLVAMLKIDLEDPKRTGEDEDEEEEDKHASAPASPPARASTTCRGCPAAPRKTRKPRPEAPAHTRVSALLAPPEHLPRANSVEEGDESCRTESDPDE